MGIRPIHCQRTARQQHQHNRLAAFVSSLQDLALQARQLQIWLVAAGELVALISFFTLQTGIQPQADYNDIAFLANTLDFGNPVIFPSQPAHPVLI
ncbi:hypothetical protein D3C75_1083060 [compost metagenome]